MTESAGGDGRMHVESPLARESLVDRRVVARTDSVREHAILSGTVMVGLGGCSVFDRGKEVLLPIVEELAKLRGERKFVVGVGGGARVRHTVSVARNLGLPTGGIAQLVGAMEEANAVMLNALLARHGSIVMQREHFWELPLYLENGMIPIVISTPPYHFWEPPPERGELPEHGSDFGLFMHAEVLGMEHVVFVKDVDGLFSVDPKKGPGVMIKETTLQAVLDRGYDDLPLDRELFETWRTSRHVKTVQIVNGRTPGQLTRAVTGYKVGTVISRGDR